MSTNQDNVEIEAKKAFREGMTFAIQSPGLTDWQIQREADAYTTNAKVAAKFVNGYMYQMGVCLNTIKATA